MLDNPTVLPEDNIVQLLRVEPIAIPIFFVTNAKNVWSMALKDRGHLGTSDEDNRDVPTQV